MSFIAALRRHGDRTAIVTDAETLSYVDLLRRVEAGVALLAAAGLGPESTVGLTIAEETEHLITSLALIALGARQITLASHDPSPVLAVLARRARVTHIMAIDGETGLEGIPTLVWRPDAGATMPLADGPDGIVYLKTSGTTGDMNIIAFTGEEVAAQARRHPEYAEERLLRLASIEHNNSKRHRLYCAYMGGANVFRPAGELDVAAFVTRHHVTCLDISRMHASDLAAQDRREVFAAIKVRTGGSAVPYDVRRAIEQRVTPLLYVRYASTETGAIAMALPGEHDEAESVGRPIAGVTVEIVDDNDMPVPAGETGHIRIRAAGMATGYLDAGPEADTRFRGGWFRPGDMGVLRPDGSLLVQGRKDDMMIFNGLNIFPAELERVLERHDAVSVAAALALPSRIHGSIPVAAVELRTGASATAAELVTYARQHLALRAPRRIIIMPALPRNSQGKILRREIAAAFEHRRAVT